LFITVFIPTYRRPRCLTRCLEALKKQTRLPDEVLVVARDGDAETRTMLRSIDPHPLELRVVTVKTPGLVAARNAALDAARGDIIAITDDDAAPLPEWLSRIEAHFRADQMVAGVGGLDRIYHGEWVEGKARGVVGMVQWHGRPVYNHHGGNGKPREVDFLKGANMSYRLAAIRNIRFDKRLRGTGAQVADDMSFSLAVKRAGWKVIYDPAVAVEHYLAPRLNGNFRSPEAHQRDQFDAATYTEYVHNETLALLEHLSPARRIVFVVWAVVVGMRDAFGLVQWLRFLPRHGSLSGQLLRSALKGRVEGWRTWRRCGR
jgi:glycosyltransferase involved in cell wall biosynthesis